MEDALKVLIYGDTLVLACLRASLEGRAGLEVCHLDRAEASEQELCALRPDVVIFDLETGQPEFQYALAQQVPALLLVGADPATNRAVVWSAHQLRELSTRDLLEVIGHQCRATDSDSEPFNGRKA